jgi:MFS family permease
MGQDSHTDGVDVADESSHLLPEANSTKDLSPKSEAAGPKRFKLTDPYVRPLVALIYLSVFSGTFISAMGTAFFPQVAQSRFGISSSYIGIVFAVLPTVISITSPGVAYVCNLIGRMPVLCFGTFVEIIGAAMFGFSSSVVSFCISRAITGFGAACTGVASMALLVSNVENLNDALGLQEILSGMGFMFGAPIGAALYSVMGFGWVFFANAIVLAIMLAYAIIEWRSNVDKWKLFEADKTGGSDPHANNEGDDDFQTIEEGQDNQNELSAEERAALPDMPSMVLMDRVMVPSAISVSVLFFILASTEPILAPHIQELLNLKTSLVGLLYAVPSILYAIFAGFAGEVSRKITAKTTLSLGLFLMGISMILCGPAPYLDQINSPAAAWGLLMASFVFMGVGLALGFVPGVPLMREGADKRVYFNRNKYKAEEKFISNFVSGVFNSAASFGQVVGPLAAGFTMEHVPQRKQITCEDPDEANCYTGIQWTTTIFGGVALVTFLMFQIVVPNYQRRKEKKIYQALPEDAEPKTETTI